MIYISKIHIENYKCFVKFDMDFHKNTNIIVGDNEAGKSTILEAINICLSGLLHGHYLRNELSEYLFNYQSITDYLKSVKANKSTIPPSILIELYLESDENSPDLENLKGTGNSAGIDKAGIRLLIEFDNQYQTQSEYEALVKKGIYNLPIEYYKMNWMSFARDSITARSIPLKPNVIDSLSVKYRNGSDFYISKIINDKLNDDERIALLQAYRNLKNDFKKIPELQAINEKINDMAKISDKNVSISVNTADVNAWENILMTYFDDIPFHQIGQGEQSIVKTNLALTNVRQDIFNVILIEEPENHLSNTRLNILLKHIEKNNPLNQIIVTTHSSFVANKLKLRNLHFLNDKKIMGFIDLSEEVQNYFYKLPGYNTLRLLLAKRVVLVEGPSDELIIQKAYRCRHGKLPIEDGIDVISVGLSAPRFLELSKTLNIKVAVVTDNDGDRDSNIVKRYENYDQFKNIKVFSNEDNKQNTLEPSFVACNTAYEQQIKDLLGYNGNKSLSEYLQTCKTEWALKVFDSDFDFNFPKYIDDCIEWIIS